MQYGFGVDIGGTTIKIGLFSVDGDLMEINTLCDRWDDQTKQIMENIFLLKLLILLIVLLKRKVSKKVM